MHETVIAKNLINEALKQGNIKGVTIEVGEVAHLTIEELQSVMGILVDWDLNFVEKKAVGKCVCGYEGSPKILSRGHDMCLYECPKCGKVPEILEGHDIILKEVKIM